MPCTNKDGVFDENDQAFGELMNWTDRVIYKLRNWHGYSKTMIEVAWLQVLASYARWLNHWGMFCLLKARICQFHSTRVENAVI